MPLKQLAEGPPVPTGVLWSSETQSLVQRGVVLPCVSNYLLPGVFGIDAADLALSWASQSKSPLSDADNSSLARVAQFVTVRENSAREARLAFHDLLKGSLLAQAKDEPGVDKEYVYGLIDDTDRRQATSFSEIARNLGYPRFPDPSRNPLRLLAELPLPMYLTTSQHTFLEVALAQTGSKHPVSEIFYWDASQDSIGSIFEREPNYQPTVDRPLVYHLFGIDTYPESMVLSEDDYVSILIRLCELKRDVKVGESGRDISSGVKFDLPSDIKRALSGFGLLLLGYNVGDWDFRVLFRWLVRYIRDSREGQYAPKAVCMQLHPDTAAGDPEKQAKIEQYLIDFFAQKDFRVYWGDPETCVWELWSRWKRS